jgi:hypothetical protein
MPDRSLAMTFDEVRDRTLRVLQGVTPRQALWTPRGLQNNILWHGGHCYVVVEKLTMRALGKPPDIPPGWFEMFSWKGRPAEITADAWPPLGEVVDRLRAQHGRLRPLIGQLSEEQLAGPVPRRPDRNARYLIVHALHDEACHTGEIWLLRKMQKAARGACLRSE